MPQNFCEPLLAVGWSARVEAAFHPLHQLGLSPARVVSIERGRCRLVSLQGDRLVAAHHVGVGDWVGLDGDRIDAVVPRWSELGRLDAEGEPQVLAANVDVVLVVAPADRLSAGRVERELVVAWDSGARPVVVVTKADLAPAGAISALQTRLVTADVVVTSATAGGGLEELGELLPYPVTAVMLGPSGAGKSTLINALLGEDRLKVGHVRRDDSRGRHTTTSRQLVSLPNGGCLIDMPGLRSLGTGAGQEAVAAAFGDLEELASACRFADCAHLTEPGCAVTAAAGTGALDPARLASFRKLQRELAHERLRHDRLARQEESRRWKSRTKAARQQRKDQER